MSFIGEQTEPTKKEPPLFDVRSDLPTFSERLQMIGKGILTYQSREPLMFRFRELAERLVENTTVS
jgi:hypothetical protein